MRESRHNLSALIEEVKRGREVIITDRGRAVARLVSIVLRDEEYLRLKILTCMLPAL